MCYLREFYRGILHNKKFMVYLIQCFCVFSVKFPHEGNIVEFYLTINKNLNYENISVIKAGSENSFDVRPPEQVCDQTYLLSAVYESFGNAMFAQASAILSLRG